MKSGYRFKRRVKKKHQQGLRRGAAMGVIGWTQEYIDGLGWGNDQDRI